MQCPFSDAELGFEGKEERFAGWKHRSESLASS